MGTSFSATVRKTPLMPTRLPNWKQNGIGQVQYAISASVPIGGNTCVIHATYDELRAEHTRLLACVSEDTAGLAKPDALRAASAVRARLAMFPGRKDHPKREQALSRLVHNDLSIRLQQYADQAYAIINSKRSTLLLDLTRTKAELCSFMNCGIDGASGKNEKKTPGQFPIRTNLTESQIFDTLYKRHSTPQATRGDKTGVLQAVGPTRQHSSSIPQNLLSAIQNGTLHRFMRGRFRTQSHATHAVTTKSSPRDHIVVATYNILAKSLGSHGIPWVLSLSSDLEAKVDRALASTTSERGHNTNPKSVLTWKHFKSHVLTPFYLRHFHKNYKSGSYTAMRLFWCHPRLENAEDVPPNLKYLRFVGPNQVAYRGREGKVHIATTLKGLLIQWLPTDLARRVFLWIYSKEVRVYAWKVRGPRLLDAILGAWGPKGDWGAADVIVLQEYDVHNAIASYQLPALNGSGSAHKGPFRHAMAAAGYCGIVFKAPKGDAGVAVFWRKNKFYFEPWAVNKGQGSHTLQCGQTLGSSAFNYDMCEASHSTRGGADGSKKLLMRDGDRRNIGAVRLVHRSTHRAVWVFAVHLMTKSRDKQGVTKYPGEVRAAEIAFARSIARRHVKTGEGLLLIGDFNLEPSDESIWSGKPRAADGVELCIETGFDAKRKALVWSHHDSRDSSKAADKLILREAFEAVHRWHLHKQDQKHCTSLNSDRRQWIDYIWHTPSTLERVGALPPVVPNGPIPNEDHPSDHLPIASRFAVRHPSPCRMCTYVETLLRQSSAFDQ